MHSNAYLIKILAVHLNKKLYTRINLKVDVNNFFPKDPSSPPFIKIISNFAYECDFSKIVVYTFYKIGRNKFYKNIPKIHSKN